MERMMMMLVVGDDQDIWNGLGMNERQVVLTFLTLSFEPVQASCELLYSSLQGLHLVSWQTPVYLLEFSVYFEMVLHAITFVAFYLKKLMLYFIFSFCKIQQKNTAIFVTDVNHTLIVIGSNICLPQRPFMPSCIPTTVFLSKHF